MYLVGRGWRLLDTAGQLDKVGKEQGGHHDQDAISEQGSHSFFCCINHPVFTTLSLAIDPLFLLYTCAVILQKKTLSLSLTPVTNPLREIRTDKNVRMSSHL